MRGAWVTAALFLSVLAVAPADACTATDSPPYEVHAVVSLAATGERLLELPTGMVHRSNPCAPGFSANPLFDGSYLGWSGPDGFVLVDVESGNEVPGIPRGHLREGVMHTISAGRLVTHDIAAATSATREPPAGMQFIRLDADVAVAVRTVDGVPSPRHGLGLLHLGTASWLLEDEPLEGTAWPQGPLGVVAANSQWVIVRAQADGLRALRVSDGSVHGPLPEQAPSSATQAAPGTAAEVEDLVGDRLYFWQRTGHPGGVAGSTHWSYRLPDAGEPGGRPPIPIHDGRIAHFELRQTDTSTPTSDPSTWNGGSGITSDGMTDGLVDSSTDGGTGTSTSRAAQAVAGLGAVAACIAALALWRRRLP